MTLHVAGSVSNDGHYRIVDVTAVTLAIRQSHYGTNHPSVATVLRNLGTLYKRAGQIERGEKYKAMARQIRTRFKKK